MILLLFIVHLFTVLSSYKSLWVDRYYMHNGGWESMLCDQWS